MVYPDLCEHEWNLESERWGSTQGCGVSYYKECKKCGKKIQLKES